MKKLKYYPLPLPAGLYGSKLLKAEKCTIDGREIVRLLFEVDGVEIVHSMPTFGSVKAQN